jgi:hypothetical protein
MTVASEGYNNGRFAPYERKMVSAAPNGAEGRIARVGLRPAGRPALPLRPGATLWASKNLGYMGNVG